MSYTGVRHSIIRGGTTSPGEFFFGQTSDLENFQWINFFWMIENYGSPLLQQRSSATRDAYERSRMEFLHIMDSEIDSPFCYTSD